MKKQWFAEQIRTLGWEPMQRLGSEEKRPEFNVCLVKDESLGSIVVKQYDPRTDDGCLGERGAQTGFVRSVVVPRAALRVAERQGLTGAPFVKILERFHLPQEEKDHYPWYFTMPFYNHGELDWTDNEDVLKALQAIYDLQGIDQQEVQGEINQMVDVPRWAQRSAQFDAPDIGRFLRYAGNMGDSVSGLVCSRFAKEEDYLNSLRVLIESGHQCLSQALSAGQEPPRVLSHRDTGKPNFCMDDDGSVVLIDWEHCRIDNALSDYTHLWLQLAGDELHDSAEVVLGFMKSQFTDLPWFEVTLRLCIAEKILGNTNHKVGQSGSVDEARQAVSAGLERMEWALGMVVTSSWQ